MIIVKVILDSGTAARHQTRIDFTFACIRKKVHEVIFDNRFRKANRLWLGPAQANSRSAPTADTASRQAPDVRCSAR